MRTLSQGPMELRSIFRKRRGAPRPTMRVIAQTLCLPFLCAAALIGLPPTPAQAQISTRTAVSESVAVVPFENRSGYPSPTLGEEAAETVGTELRDRLQLDVMGAADVALQMRELGMAIPLGDVELIRLATELEVTMVITGEVRKAELVRDPAGVHGEVTLAVRLFDRVAEDTVNGAVVAAKGPASINTAEDVLLGKALQQAAFQAVQEMRTRPSVVATVLWAREEILYISVGARAGVSTGMEMAAIRDGKRIALVQVTSSDALGSYARHISGAVLRPGDQLRGIYKLPSAAGAPSPERVYRRKHTIETMLIATAGLLGLANVGSAARLLEEGGIAMPGLVASNLANVRQIVDADPLSFSPYGATLITWVPYDEPTQNREVVGYEIWREQGDVLGIVDVVWVQELLQNVVIDYPWIMGVFYKTYGMTVDPATGLLTLGAMSISSIDPDNPPPMLSVTADTDSVDYIFWLIGPFPGQRYTYRVRPIVIERTRTAAGTYSWVLRRDTQFSTAPNYLTSIGPPITSGVFIAGTMATFFFYTPIGADEAIIEIARDPFNRFPPAQTYSQTIPGTWTDQDPYVLVRVDVDLNNVFNLPGSGNFFWWRVGSRHRNDTTFPRPYPLPSPTDPTDPQWNDLYWVWSDIQRITLFPPTGKSALLHQQRQALARAGLGKGRVLGQRPSDRRVRVQ